MTISKPSRFQGDPKIYIDENGADWKYPGDGGQPVMDAGLENAALISKFTRKGWWGNAVLPVKNQIGSDLELTAEKSITSSSLGDVEDQDYKALQWMVDTGLARSVSSTAENPNGRKTKLTTLILNPSGDVTTLLTIRNGMNWIFQKIDPASEK